MSNCISATEHDLRALMMMRANRDSFEQYKSMLNTTLDYLVDQIKDCRDTIEIHQAQGKIQLITELLEVFDTASTALKHANSKR